MSMTSMLFIADESPKCTCDMATLDKSPSPALPLVALLAELATVIGQLSDAQYAQKPVGVMPSSIGGHVRHCLDHVAALLAARVTGSLDYDQRQRGTTIEFDRAAAITAIESFMDVLRSWTDRDMESPLRLSVLLTSDGEPISVATTLGRELAFTLSHTIHHNAIVGAMVKTLGGALPERFGYAPATLQHATRKAG